VTQKVIEQHPLILVVGRPGSGKSAFVRALLRSLSHPGALALNDYTLLLQRIESLDQTQIRWTSEGQFEILDRAIFDDLLRELVGTALANRATRPVILEFSRDKYSEALKKFPEFINDPPLIIYIDCPLEICVQRNAARAPGYPINVVPESVIRSHYAQDDLAALIAAFPGAIRRVDSSSHSLTALEREALLLLSELQGKPAETIASVATFRKELAAAGLILSYTLVFGTLAAAAWRADPGSLFGRIAPAGSFSLLKTILLVMSAGGLGSTTYCMRALYHYYIRGMFDFDRFKWWYLFRPLAGALLSVAAFTLVTGGSAALGTPNSNAPSNLSWFGVSYLAGFGTEQVIEWLRRASKSVFGESSVQPDDERPAG
jgi:hypothetical protein